MTIRKPEKTIRFFWLRHAPPLNANGLVYGADMAVDLSDRFLIASQAFRLPPDALWYSSVYQRTIDTATALAVFRPPARPIQARPGFNEQSFGLWAGKARAEVAKDPAFARYLASPAFIAPPGGENLVDFSARVRDEIITLLREPPAGRQDGRHDFRIIVAHAGTIRAALGMAVGKSLAKMLKLPVDPLSLTAIDYNDAWRRRTGNPWAVRGINISP